MTGPWFWLAWAPALMVQQAAATWVSRARNSSSVRYHGVASVFSNGVWFLSQVAIIDRVGHALRSGDVALIAFTGAFYMFFCTAGAVAMHVVLLRLERGRTLYSYDGGGE